MKTKKKIIWIKDLTITEIEKEIAAWESDKHEEDSLMGIIINRITFDDEMRGEEGGPINQLFAVELDAVECKDLSKRKGFYKVYLWDTESHVIWWDKTITKKEFLDQETWNMF